MTHPPNICRISSKASREGAVAGWNQIPSLSQKYGVNALSFDHFDPEHFLTAMFEADGIEAVSDFAMEAGLMAWNHLKIDPAAGVSEFMDIWTKHHRQSSEAELLILSLF